MILYGLTTLMKKKKKLSSVESKKVMNLLCDTIAYNLLDSGLYPGTEQFDELFDTIIINIAEEVKVRVITKIRDEIDQ